MAKVEVEVPRKLERTLAAAAIKGRTRQSNGHACAQVSERSILRLASRLPDQTIVYIDGVKHSVENNAFVAAKS